VTGRTAADSQGALPPRRQGMRLGRLLQARESALILIILALCIVMSFASPYFLTWGNVRAMLLSFSIEGIAVVGMTIIIIVGGIDLSIGAVMCLAMVVAGRLFLSGVDPWIASLGGIGVAGMVGAAMGFVVTRIGLNFFITSLAFLGIARGACFIVTGGTPLSLFTLPKSFSFIGQGDLFNIPVSIIVFLIVVVIADILLRNATMFRKVFYTGSNERAAIYSGIRVDRVKFWATVLCSTLAGVAGIVFMARFGAATPTFGVGMELNIIAAAVIGGASLNGGRGSVLGAILGIALLSMVTSSMILLDVSIFWQETIKGLILLAAVSIDRFANRHRS